MIIGHIAKAHWHTFLVLTKRPERALEFCYRIAHYPQGNESEKPVNGLPPNLYFGVTAENQKRYEERWLIAQDIPAAVRFVSVEPMLSYINIQKWLPEPPEEIPFRLNADVLQWVIAGCETGPGARPMNPEWARALKDQCKIAGVPFFFKKESKGIPVPDYIKVREYPK